MYASVNCVVIGSGNGLQPVKRQAITWAKNDLSPVRPLGTNSSEIQRNVFESIVCELSAILFRSVTVNSLAVLGSREEAPIRPTWEEYLEKLDALYTDPETREQVLREDKAYYELAKVGRECRCILHDVTYCLSKELTKDVP